MTAAGSRPRVLTVDDDPVLLRLLSRILSQAGYDVVESLTAGDARKHLRSGSFSLLVTDLNMPDESGLELARSLRGSDARLPIIILSGSLEESVRREAVALGRVECLDKPLDQGELLLKVKDLIGIDPSPAS
jgi:DNA-binding response OmpR family regulator